MVGEVIHFHKEVKPYRIDVEEFGYPGVDPKVVKTSARVPVVFQIVRP